jgi:uncharacterized protein YbjT (DUF2867 family)
MRHIDAVSDLIDKRQPLTVVASASVRNPAHPRSTEFQSLEVSLMRSKPEALVVLRPTMIYGSSGDRNIRLLTRVLMALPAIPRFIGGSVVQPVLADDVADAVATTLGASGIVEADLGGPVPVRLGEIVEKLAQHIDRRVVPIPIPVAALAWVSQIVFRFRPSRGIHALSMLRHDRDVVPSGEEILGHSPTTLDEGLALAVARYKIASK